MIYFLEDDASIQKLVCYALNKEGHEIKGLSLPSEFWKEMQVKIPELVLLDIMLPEEDGISVLKKLRDDKKYQDIPVIMLTAKTSEFDKVTGLDMGADDYITKPFGMTELASRVNAVLRRYRKTQTLDSKEYTIGDLYVNPEKHIIKLNGEDLLLSFKEYSLLMVLLEADGKVVSREELLTKIWGEYYEESRTLDVHIRKLRVKLENSDVKIETVKNIGYKIGGPNNEQ